METPACPRPQDSREQQILDHLAVLRDKLLLLKRDSTTYMKSQDVLDIYDDLVEHVRELGEIRPHGQPEGETQLDRVLESCFQLVSLAFMTTGRNNEAPAAFALTSTIRRLVDHLLEKDFLYTATDLGRIAQALDKLEQIVREKTAHIGEGDACKKSPHVCALLAARIERLQASVGALQKRLEIFQGPMADIHERLISILRAISTENTRSRFSPETISKLRDETRDIDSSRVDGKFVSVSGEVYQGNDELCHVLEFTLGWADTVLESKGIIPDAFQPIYRALLRIRDSLEKFSLTQTWSMRETDLYDYQRQLDRLDETRKNGRWVDDEGNPASSYVQGTLVYLIRKSYALIFLLMMSSEPVSEALIPILSQIQTLKSCLIEVKNAGGVESIRELYPYMLKLDSIRKMRDKDGKFAVGGDVPHGQLALNAKLLECERLMEELRHSA